MFKVKPHPRSTIESARGSKDVETFPMKTACPRCDSVEGQVMTEQAQSATRRKFACNGCLLLTADGWDPEPA
jgi:hypothetical protein